VTRDGNKNSIVGLMDMHGRSVIPYVALIDRACLGGHSVVREAEGRHVQPALAAAKRVDPIASAAPARPRPLYGLHRFVAGKRLREGGAAFRGSLLSGWCLSCLGSGDRSAMAIDTRRDAVTPLTALTTHEGNTLVRTRPYARTERLISDLEAGPQ
jgi:hypothetical protein